MAKYQIQTAQLPADLQAVSLLLRAYGELRRYDAALGHFSAEWQNLPGAYAPPEGCLLLARYEKQAAGCVAYRRLSPEYCEMKRLFVLPDFQGQGIGRALIARLIEEAKRAGYRRMRLDSHPWMKAAASLYAAFGFVEISRYNPNPTPGIRFFEKVL